MPGDLEGRTETVIDTGLAYRPGDAVRVRVIRRPAHRVEITDDGGAIERAGKPAGWRDVAAQLERELIVNISRRGVVSLPVVGAGPDEDVVIARIAEASLALYDELLELSVLA